MGNNSVIKRIHCPRIQLCLTLLAAAGVFIIFCGVIMVALELPSIPRTKFLDTFSENAYTNDQKRSWHFFIYNWTNADEVATLKRAPTFDKLGPFSFEEKIEMSDVSWKKDRITFKKKKKFFPLTFDGLNGNVTNIDIFELMSVVDYKLAVPYRLSTSLFVKEMTILEWMVPKFKSRFEHPGYKLLFTLMGSNGSVEEDGVWTYSANGSFLEWRSWNGMQSVDALPPSKYGTDCVYIPRGCTRFCRDFLLNVIDVKPMVCEECTFCNPPFVFDFHCDPANTRYYCKVFRTEYDYSYSISLGIDPRLFQFLQSDVYPLVQIHYESESQIYSKKAERRKLAFEIMMAGAALLLTAFFTFTVTYWLLWKRGKNRMQEAGQYQELTNCASS